MVTSYVQFQTCAFLSRNIEALEIITLPTQIQGKLKPPYTYFKLAYTKLKFRALEVDALNGFAALKNVSRVNSNTEIYVAGASLGGGFAASFAANLVTSDPVYGKNVKGLVVASTYISYGMIATYRLKNIISQLDPNLAPLEAVGGFGGKGSIQDVTAGAFIDAGLSLLGEGMNTAKSLKTFQSATQNKVPILIVGESRDSVIPVWHAKALFRGCTGVVVSSDKDTTGVWYSRSGVTLIIYPGEHVSFINNPSFYQDLRTIMKA